MLARARTALVLEHPFFGSMALRLTLSCDPSCRDLWTNGKTLGFNPAFVAVTPKKALEAAIAHEILHLALGHHIRRKGRDPSLWNTACDYAVNLLLREAGFTLPKNSICDDRYLDLSADRIFTLLPSLDEQSPHGGAHNAKQTKETSMPAMGGQSLGGAKQESNSQEKHAQADGKRQEQNKDEVAGHSASEGSEGQGEKGAYFQGEVRDHPDLQGGLEKQGEKKALEDAHIALSMALQRAFHEGDMPGRFQRLLKERIAPRMDWQELLQRFLEQCVLNDSTWTQPNRRYIHQGLYLPSRSEPAIPSLCLAIDTSGSIDDDLLELFCAELSNILAIYETKLTILMHDSTIQDVVTVTRANLPLHIEPKGGGGTDFRPVCEWIEREGLHPICLLWFTDLECSRYPAEPAYPVLWITTAKSGKPPFGDVLELVS
ncbi:MAG: hypothetical protein IJU76_04770 [Desulfovibrionaceae bacterium]|nr:hypothetical protein [Desulfovibrionaceae bacterium]